MLAKLASTFALAAAVCLPGSPAAAGSSTAPASSGKVCPSQAQIDMMLANASASMQQADYSQAAATLQPFSEQHCDPRVSLLLAGAYEAGGDLPRAGQTLQHAHAAWPANNSIAASLARQYMEQHQVEKAGQALARFHANAQTPLQEMQLAAVVFLANHQLMAARAVAEAAYHASPSEQTLLLLANTMQLQGRFKDVVTLLNARRSLYSESAAFLITVAESEYDSILYDAARSDLQHAVALDPNSYQGHFLLGNALIKLDHADDAIAEYRRAIELSPEQPRTYYQLALALQSKQDEAGAQEQLAKAISIDAHYGPALLEMSKILISENRLPDAVSHLNVAIADNPRSEQGYFLLAKAYAQLGDKQKSDEMAKRLVLVRNSNWKGDAREQHAPVANP